MARAKACRVALWRVRVLAPAAQGFPAMLGLPACAANSLRARWALRSNRRREFDGRSALCAQAGNPALLGCARARATAPRGMPSPIRWWTAMERSDVPIVLPAPSPFTVNSQDCAAPARAHEHEQSGRMRALRMSPKARGASGAPPDRQDLRRRAAQPWSGRAQRASLFWLTAPCPSGAPEGRAASCAVPDQDEQRRETGPQGRSPQFLPVRRGAW